MPGYVIHLAVAEKLIDACNIGKKTRLWPEDRLRSEEDSINRFLLGSIVPDTKKGSLKKESHFWSDETMSHFQRKPDLEAFLAAYGRDLSDPFVFGYYAHLYLDYKFVSEYWRSHFSFFDDNMQSTDAFDSVRWVKCAETLRDTGSPVPRERFFSEAYYYGDYSRMNDYVMQAYDIRMPHFNFAGAHPDADISIIGEIGGEDLIPALWEMLSFLESAFSKMPHAYIDEAAVQESLKVFNLKAMKELIAQTAEELCIFAKSNGIFVE